MQSLCISNESANFCLRNASYAVTANNALSLSLSLKYSWKCSSPLKYLLGQNTENVKYTRRFSTIVFFHCTQPENCECVKCDGYCTDPFRYRRMIGHAIAPDTSPRMKDYIATWPPRARRTLINGPLHQCQTFRRISVSRQCRMFN